jgi:hypothetical protein
MEIITVCCTLWLTCVSLTATGTKSKQHHQGTGNCVFHSRSSANICCVCFCNRHKRQRQRTYILAPPRYGMCFSFHVRPPLTSVAFASATGNRKEQGTYTLHCLLLITFWHVSCFVSGTGKNHRPGMICWSILVFFTNCVAFHRLRRGSWWLWRGPW